MSIFVTDTAKTKAKETLQKRRNLFGLGVTSLIAACAGDEAGGTGGGGGNPVTPAGDIGDRPTAPFFPAKLSATEQLLAETSIEKLAPVADDNGYITASASDPDSTRNNLKNLVVTIDAASGLVDSNFEMTFKNGNHDTVNPFVSVYQLKEGTNDLVVTSAGFGDPSGANITGAIYIFWDIEERISLDNVDTASNFLKIESNSIAAAIGQYAPEFLHIGGDTQYDMVFGAYGGTDRDYLYILWDVAKYAGASSAANQSINVRSTAAVQHGLLRIENDFGDKSNIAKHSPEFFHLGGADGATSRMPQYDMVIRGVGDGTTANQDRIHILWDINEYDDGDASVPRTVLLNDDALVRLAIQESFNAKNPSNIAKHAPKFLQIGGDDGAGHDMVIRSEDATGDNTAIYILWDVDAYFGLKTNSGEDNENYKDIRLKGLFGPRNSATHNNHATKGLLEITGVAGENIVKHSPEFLHIGGVGDTANGNASQQDMIIRSEDGTGAIYILWDVNKHYNTTATTTIDLSSITAINVLKITGADAENIGEYSPELFELAGTDTQDEMVIRSDTAIYVLWDVAAYYNVRDSIDLSSNSAANGLLKITGENIGAYSPEFLQIAGTTTQEDMVIRSDTAIYVLWDVAEYHSATPTPINLSTNDGITKGLLKITGTSADTEIGSSAPDILKINNNNDYDMIIKSDANMYVLWDFTKDYSATTPASVSLTTAASTGNGLLTISGAGTANILKDDSTGFADIDGKGINDIVFTYENNTFILFGEKVADRDTNEKAISHEVDMGNLTGLSGSADGYFGYDGVDSIGYRFAGVETNLAAVALPSSLSDADAVWDIA